MLGEDRRNKILARVTPLLREIDSEVSLHDVLLDSTRQQLVFVMQKGEWPILIGINWLDYVSHRDGDLQARIQEGLRRRLELARERQRRAEQED